MEEQFEILEKLLSLASEGSVDDFARKKLRSAALAHRLLPRKPLADMFVKVGDNTFKSVLDAMCANEPGADMMLGFYHPDLSENWDYDTPTKSIMVGRKGMGWIEHFHYDPYSFEKWNFNERFKKSRGMVMGQFTHFHVPESIKAHTARSNAGGDIAYESRLMPFDELHAQAASGGIVPFRARLCAYTQEARFAFSVDLLDNCLVQDFRASKLPPKGRVFRAPLDCLAFDRVYAAEKLPQQVANAFMLLFEREGTTVYDLSHVAGLNEASSRNTLQALVSRNLARKEGSTPRENYYADMDSIKKMAERL
ncbi:MAG: hypothetical protein V1934_06245 [Methanobacteriota archaeon]